MVFIIVLRRHIQMLSKINNVNQPLTWIELLETIFFLSRSRMTIPSLISSQKRQSRCHLLWQFWAILRFIGHFLCCPKSVTKSNLNLQILLKSSPRSFTDTNWGCRTTMEGPASPGGTMWPALLNIVTPLLSGHCTVSTEGGKSTSSDGLPELYSSTMEIKLINVFN